MDSDPITVRGIAVRRCQLLIQKSGGNGNKLNRVVHVGDAPEDVLAAKHYASLAPEGMTVGSIWETILSIPFVK